MEDSVISLEPCKTAKTIHWGYNELSKLDAIYWFNEGTAKAQWRQLVTDGKC